jgi:hypothetical protein
MIELTASGGAFSGNSIVRLKPQSTPSLLVYQNKGGFIDYANGYTDTITFNEPGIVLHFEPYYFSIVKNVLDELAFDLHIDSEAVNSDTPNEIGLSRPVTAGQSSVTMAITPVAYSLQHVEKTFNLLFN